MNWRISGNVLVLAIHSFDAWYRMDRIFIARNCKNKRLSLIKLSRNFRRTREIHRRRGSVIDSSLWIANWKSFSENSQHSERNQSSWNFLFLRWNYNFKFILFFSLFPSMSSFGSTWSSSVNNQLFLFLFKDLKFQQLSLRLHNFFCVLIFDFLSFDLYTCVLADVKLSRFFIVQKKLFPTANLIITWWTRWIECRVQLSL